MTRHPVPRKFLEEDIAIIGRRGRGKTFTAKGMVELLIREGQRVVVLDPMGAWWGLNVHHDGKHRGLNMPVFGGDYPTIPTWGRGKRLERKRPMYRAGAMVSPSVPSLRAPKTS